MYRSDYAKSRHLRQASDNGAFEDEDGFVWERAREADLFRVQFSRLVQKELEMFDFNIVSFSCKI